MADSDWNLSPGPYHKLLKFAMQPRRDNENKMTNDSLFLCLSLADLMMKIVLV